MAAIEILSDLYITSQKKDSPDEGLKEMDYFDKIKFLSQQKPSVASRKDSHDDTKIVYFPILGNYKFYFKPQGEYIYIKKEDALFRANETHNKLENIFAESILFFMNLKEKCNLKVSSD